MTALNIIGKYNSRRYHLLLISILILAMSASGFAENRVSFGVGRAGSSQPVDTLIVGGEYEFQFYIENDFILGGMSLGFEVWSTDGAGWSWANVGGSGATAECVTIVPGSRMDPDGDGDASEVFDMTGLLITEQDVNEVSDPNDIIMFGGVALDAGLSAGPLEHMVSYHFNPVGPLTPGYIGTICIDSINVPPCGSNFFVDQYGSAFPPIFDEPLCMPVKVICGNPNGDDDVNVGDAVFMLNYVFREGKAPVPLYLGDANCDGALDVGDVVFLIAAAFRYGPQPECPDYMPPSYSPGGDSPADGHEYQPNDILCDSLFFRFQ